MGKATTKASYSKEQSTASARSRTHESRFDETLKCVQPENTVITGIGFGFGLDTTMAIA
jgi:hypothetical protein